MNTLALTILLAHSIGAVVILIGAAAAALAGDRDGAKASGLV